MIKHATIQHINEHDAWILSTAHTAYVMKITEDGVLRHLYWGERLYTPTDYPGLGRPLYSERLQQTEYLMTSEEYPAWGGLMYSEPALKASFPDGVRGLDLRYSGYEDLSTDLPHLVITLKDVHYSLEVDLHYRLFTDCDLLERWTVIRNVGQEWLDLETVLSAAWHLPIFYDGNYRLTHLSGRWNSETQIRRQPLTAGRMVLESRRNYTSAEANPFFAIDHVDAEGQGATEETGQVWFGALGWTGNWKIAIEQQQDPIRVYVAGGINDFDFRWRLSPSEEFTTPSFISGYSDQGFGQASRNLHHYQLDYLLPREHAHKIRPVLYNSWEAVYFDVQEEKQIALARRAAELGVELFVIDDGWFGKRDHDMAGLGDWYINQEKLPRGLQPIIDEVLKLGMRFGIWVEPEMVNPDSDLYRTHPNWIFHFPTREGKLFRNQLMLNLAIPEVTHFIFTTLDQLLSQHPDITFIKWDFNRPISEPGWPTAPLEQQREAYVRSPRAVYSIVEQLRTRHPHVVWEACASGGARVDLGALKRFDQCWPSDNTDPYDRLIIQEGYSLAYAPKAMMAWVTDSITSLEINNVALDLTYRFHSAMTGSLGLGEDLNHYNQEQMQIVKQLINDYKKIRHIVQQGDLYRLNSPRKGSLTAVQYVSRDQKESVIFAFRHHDHFWQVAPRIYLRGLQLDDFYIVEGCPGDKGPLSGQSLMRTGLTPSLHGHFASSMITVKKIK